jgi:hypothetical protein
LATLEGWSEGMAAEIQGLIQEGIETFGPETLSKIELHLQYKIKNITQLHRYLSVSFYRGFRIVLGVGEELALKLDKPKTTITG